MNGKEGGERLHGKIPSKPFKSTFFDVIFPWYFVIDKCPKQQNDHKRYSCQMMSFMSSTSECRECGDFEGIDQNCPLASSYHMKSPKEYTKARETLSIDHSCP
jgi:hypothetical protein